MDALGIVARLARDLVPSGITKATSEPREVPAAAVTDTRMDPLTALGLAANIIQFVGFAASLISTSREVYSLATGTGRDITTLAIVHNQLEKLSRDLNFSDSGDKDSAELSQLAQTVRDLSQSCKLDCDSLLKAVQRLQTRN
ncbi:nacht nucleoside triphosphatase [Fusarium coicis]|nr:nacht nucleoside triphosphatase [Fusarium coicis]